MRPVQVTDAVGVEVRAVRTRVPTSSEAAWKNNAPRGVDVTRDDVGIAWCGSEPGENSGATPLKSMLGSQKLPIDGGLWGIEDRDSLERSGIETPVKPPDRYYPDDRLAPVAIWAAPRVLSRDLKAQSSGATRVARSSQLAAARVHTALRGGRDNALTQVSRAERAESIDVEFYDVYRIGRKRVLDNGSQPIYLFSMRDDLVWIGYRVCRLRTAGM